MHPRPDIVLIRTVTGYVRHNAVLHSCSGRAPTLHTPCERLVQSLLHNGGSPFWSSLLTQETLLRTYFSTAARRLSPFCKNPIYERVQRDEFWRNANGEPVANAATYGATLYNLDAKARDIYEIVRERTNSQFGLSVDELRAAHPGNEEARRNALFNAVDDRLAALRADGQAADNRSEAERKRDEEEEANVEQRQPDADLARERAEAADERAEEREDAAAFHRGEERAHEAEARGVHGRGNGAGR